MMGRVEELPFEAARVALSKGAVNARKVLHTKEFWGVIGCANKSKAACAEHNQPVDVIQRGQDVGRNNRDALVGRELT